MKLLTLAKRLDFQTEMDYFDYCIDSHINGNFDQCRELFRALTKKDKKRLIDYCNDYPETKRFYFNLL